MKAWTHVLLLAALLVLSGVVVSTAGTSYTIPPVSERLSGSNAALAISQLAPFRQIALNGDATSAGVGLRGTGTGAIILSRVPDGATVQKAFLYWATLGTDGTFTAPTLNGEAVSGALIGQSGDPSWGAQHSFAYRADVTSLVTGNGTYTVAGLPASGPTVNDSEGAGLVVLYTLPDAPLRVITINDGAVTLTSSGVASYMTTLGGFAATNPLLGAKLTFIVGDGQSSEAPEYAYLNTTLLDINQFSGGDGNYWDTRAYNVSTLLAPGATSANAVVITLKDALVWVAAILSVPGELNSPGAADFNADGKPDLLWQHLITGQVYVWYMDGPNFLHDQFVGSVDDPNWRIVGVADFNADGKPDLLWQHLITGQVYVWYMDGPNFLHDQFVGSVDDPNWRIVGVADFNADGKPDLLWQHLITGQVYVWYMDGPNFLHDQFVGSVDDPNWRIVGVADFNADGKPDLLWQHLITGQVYVWYMDGPNFLHDQFVGSVDDPNWRIVGVADFNADGKPDLLWQHLITGQVYVWYMDGPNFLHDQFVGSVDDPNWRIMGGGGIWP